ncbi:glycosyltransferase family 2 protein [Dactylosporangium sp. NPDC051541]|uniref:glycosyltransferase family 2 protein n=1 Tax=Dactylosporangium sp. NPDC051541 TaxID=3363977 RepID=UPI0037AC4C6A
MPDRGSTVADTPDVTVALACHTERRWASICAAIRSIGTQTLRPRQVVVAVDHNGDLAAALRGEFPEAVVVENTGPQRGASSTRNAAVAAVTTPVVAFLDDDEVADPAWLARLMGPLDDPAVVGTGGRYRPRWPRRQPWWFPAEFGWVVGAHYRGMPVVTTPVRNVWAGSMAVRVEAFRSVDGFRVDFGKVGNRSQPEDTDLCVRVARRTGGRWMYVPDAIVDHEVPPSRATLRFFLRRCFSEGAGKVAMRGSLDTSQTGVLGAEMSYIRRVVPLAFLRDLATGRLGRAGVIALGVLASGLGATAAWLRPVRPAQ